MEKTMKIIINRSKGRFLKVFSLHIYRLEISVWMTYLYFTMNEVDFGPNFLDITYNYLWGKLRRESMINLILRPHRTTNIEKQVTAWLIALLGVNETVCWFQLSVSVSKFEIDTKLFTEFDYFDIYHTFNRKS